MNKTGIEWTDYTWNPITGCLHNCPYCYAKKLATRFNGGNFEPTFHPDRIDDPFKVKKPSMIFVGSMTDLGGPWCKDEWIDVILKTVDSCTHHIFQFLTKNPANLSKKFGEKTRSNVWIGTTIENSEPSNWWRYSHMKDFHRVGVRFISFEPLQGPIDHNFYGIDWVIIGAQTDPLILPKAEWVTDIIQKARNLEIPVFMKNSLKSLGLPLIQEYPGEE